MEYIYKLIDLINGYDEDHRQDEEQIRDLICFLSDDSKYMEMELCRSVIFEAAQKLRMFGYIQGSNRITQEELGHSLISSIKHSAIQKYYTSKAYSNNLLDRRQKEVIDVFMALEQKRILVSAPTSFGKTFLLREILFLNRHRYNNILLVFPTVALLNENTDSINKLIDAFQLDYKVVNNVYTGVDDSEKHIFILTPERTLKMLSDNMDLKIDFFFFDEMYKIDEDFFVVEGKSEGKLNDRALEDLREEKKEQSNRAKAFRIVLYLLAKKVPEYYLAGPYLNLESVRDGMKAFLKKNNIHTIQVTLEPTARIELEAWKKNLIEIHPITGEKRIPLYSHSNPSVKEKVSGIMQYLMNNNLGQAIFYCSCPRKTMEYTALIRTLIPQSYKNRIPEDFINHLKKRYNVKMGRTDDSYRYWGLINALQNGIGIHHGKFPKYVQNEILRLFNDGAIDFLFCTSTIIEGVNTNAKNIIILNNSAGRTKLTAFSLKNIKGRAGRYYHHTIGRVFYTDLEQRKIENSTELQLNFQTYDECALRKEDIDNAHLEDLIGENRNEKQIREQSFNKELLPDEVFIKNRLYPRDVQEKYLRHLSIRKVFGTFYRLIGRTSDIRFFLENQMMEKILQTFGTVGIIDQHDVIVYNAVIGAYSKKGTGGILEYQIKKIDNDKEKVDQAYIKTFEQIRTIVEYEVPKLLCLFEAIFQQAGRLRGINMDGFNLSSIVRFFELGVKTELGMYLVEYGFPTDTIHRLESEYPMIAEMEAVDAALLVHDSWKIQRILDSYELNLFEKAIQKITR